MERMDQVIGGVPSHLVRVVLPWLAMSCAVALTLVSKPMFLPKGANSSR